MDHFILDHIYLRIENIYVLIFGLLVTNMRMYVCFALIKDAASLSIMINRIIHVIIAGAQNILM